MNEENIETLRWSGNHLEMIDQRILPEEFTYISYKSAKSVAEGIQSMVIRELLQLDVLLHMVLR